MSDAPADNGTDEVPTPTRIEVVSGGSVSAEVLAAVVVALAPADGGEERSSSDAGPTSGPPAWAQAAILEGIGSRPPTRPSDLRRTAMLG